MLPPGSAAMLLLFDLTPDAIVEHDDWHTREHMSERLSIPGFVRGSRWTALSDGPRYFVMYEVESIDVLGSAAYRQRLDNPTPWTAKMMRSYVGMRRAFCEVVAGYGAGIGHAALLLRLEPLRDRRTQAHESLRERLAGLARRTGIVSAHLLVSALDPRMTREQEIRGRDERIDSAVLVTGYSADVVRSLTAELAEDALVAPGSASEHRAAGGYGLACTLEAREVGDLAPRRVTPA
ncbi:MAG: hypothetical protein BroJett024_42770 [Alphaproteobacteria bacterium]|nr:MAG: hypothetical protein BroJett024_42770 [Alphaproteobacteria bacterium]